MSDIVRPLKLETLDEGSQYDFFPVEIDPTEDYLLGFGLAVGDINYLVRRSSDTGVQDIEFVSPDCSSKLASNIQNAIKIHGYTIDTPQASDDGKVVEYDHDTGTFVYGDKTTGGDEKVKVSSNDTTADYLKAKLSNNGNVKFYEENDGSNETLKADAELEIGDLEDVEIESGEPSNYDILTYKESEGNWIPVNIGVLIAPVLSTTCGYQGSAKGNWLEFFRDIPSNEAGYVVITDCLLKGLSVAIKKWNNSGTFVFRVYKNGGEITTLSIIYPNTIAYRSDLDISLSAGDELSVYGTNASPDVEYPIFNIFLRKDV